MTTITRLLLAAALGAASPGPSAQQAAPPAVVVTAVTERDVTPSIEHVGRVEAVSTVAIRARVSGILEEKDFEEGRNVKRGARLFLIEQEPYQLVVEQRRADLAGAQATLRNAVAKLKRNRDLKKRQAVSQADLDASEADEAIAKASVLQAKVALKEAQLDLGYTEIFAPIHGQASRASYSVGNLVGPDSEPLATITSVDPIHVSIAVSEKDLLWARRRGIDLDNPRVEPVLTLSDGNSYEHDGEFDYLGTQVDQSTDTVIARAKFPNPAGLLLPGQFVRLAVRQKERQLALVVPQAAVQEDREGVFVVVVRDDNTVEQRRISVGAQIDGVWAVSEGLQKGERIIVQGLQKVRPDMPVKPVPLGEQ